MSALHCKIGNNDYNLRIRIGDSNVIHAGKKEKGRMSPSKLTAACGAQERASVINVRETQHKKEITCKSCLKVLSTVEENSSVSEKERFVIKHKNSGLYYRGGDKEINRWCEALENAAHYKNLNRTIDNIRKPVYRTICGEELSTSDVNNMSREEKRYKRPRPVLKVDKENFEIIRIAIKAEALYPVTL